MVPNQDGMVIRVKKVKIYGLCGRTSVIPCLNGFTAEVREIVPTHPRFHWQCLLALVPNDFPINSNSRSKVQALDGKDDPTKKIFGIDPLYGELFNVKVISRSGGLPDDDVIHIRYDKQERTVSFKCSTFEYR